LEPAIGLALKLVGLALFLALSTFAAAGQACLFHTNRARLRSLSEHGTRRVEAVLGVLEQPASSFSSVTTLQTVGLVGAATLAFLAGQELGPERGAAPLGTVLGALLLALVLQVLARTVAIARPEATALRLLRPLSIIGTLFSALVLPVRSLERRLLSLYGVNRPNDPHSAEEELRRLVESGEQDGLLEREERNMIHGIFELGEVTAREVMVPRIDVVGIPSTALVDQVVDLIVGTGHSRLPIYEESLDEIVGIVYAKDVLKHLKTGRLEDAVRPLARNAYFVPEAKMVDELLQEMQQRRVHMAVVVDEYGGTAGIITIEDLLEEIVGEIRDEYDQAEEARVQQISDHEAILDARVSLREVNELLSLELPEDDFDTLGGLVYDRLGKVPSVNDEIREDGCLLRVLSTEGLRIKKVRLVVGGDDSATSGRDD
jgi:CBS domain containing-hemolysin-like protein